MKNFKKIILIVLIILLTGIKISTADEIPSWDQNKILFPKLFGMNIGKKHYDDENYQRLLSKYDMVILGFYRGWEKSRNTTIEEVTFKIKKNNPYIKIGQYTILNEFVDNRKDEAKRDIIEKLDKESWWLVNSNNEKLQWTRKYAAFEVNFTEFTKEDESGRRFPEWLAERNYNVFFKNNVNFDIWYLDNLFYQPRVVSADWKRRGYNELSSNEQIQKAYRKGYIAYLQKAKELAPNIIFIANADNDLNYEEYKYQFQGVFLEGLMGYSWSLETWAGWEKMMERYHNVFQFLLHPKIVVFHVIGNPKDKKFFRYAYTSCLMNDGHFSFSDINEEYSSVVWFKEFDFKLGSPIEEPQTKPWKDGVYRREYENGIVYVNPSKKPFILDNEKGLRSSSSEEEVINIKKNQSSDKNIFINSKDGIILYKHLGLTGSGL